MSQDLLIEKMIEYDKLYNTVIKIEVESLGFKLDYQINFSLYGYPHMIGLGKYTGINLLKKFAEKKINAKDIIKDIKKGNISYGMLQRTGLWDSEGYGPLLKERIDSFDYINIIDLLQQDIIVYFNKSLLNTDFDADFIIYDVKSGKHYHISLFYKDRIKRDGNLIASSYFIDDGNRYIINQKSAIVKEINVIDKNTNNLLVTKMFENKIS